MRRIDRLIWVLAILVIASPVAWAGSGASFRLPSGPGVRNRSGLTLQVDTRWVDGPGYRAVRFRVANTNGAPAAADRTLRLEFRPHGWRYYGEQPERTIAYLEFPQGAADADTWVPVRQNSIWGSFELEVYEDGQLHKDLSSHLSIGVMNQYSEWTESFPSILFIDQQMPPLDSPPGRQLLSGTAGQNQLPDLRLLATLYADNPYYGLPDTSGHRLAPISDLALRDRLDKLKKYDVRCSDDLPDEWILYSCFDLIVISLDDARQLATEQPDKWNAILRHVATGTTLCVYGVGRSFEYLGELETICRLPDAARTGQSLDEVLGRWQTPSLPSRRQPSESIDANLRSVRMQERQQMGMSEIMADFQSPNSLTRKLEQPFDFRWRAIQLGRLVAIDEESPFPGDLSSWTRLLDSVGQERLKWRSRLGMSMTEPNNEFWNLMIPGVGMAPVTSFMVLITLFVIVLGPVNYVLLNRWKRLYLLLVTVPGGAAIVTLLLFGYAVINDGLGVRVRSRSYTELDQRNRQFVSWARQTYYAGLAPSGGMSFPRGTEVYPIHETPRDWDYGAGRARYQTTWEDLQYLQGYFSSRTTSQFMTINSAHTNHHLNVRENPDGSPSIGNMLGTDIRWLLLCDSNGQLFGGKDVERDVTVQLVPADLNQSQDRLREIERDCHPDYPEGYDPNLSQYYYRGRRRYYYYPGYTNLENSVADPNMMSSLLEQKIKERMAVVGNPLPSRSYMAVVAWAPDSPLGVDRVREEGSLHVVFGRW